MKLKIRQNEQCEKGWQTKILKKFLDDDERNEEE
jgi:hypothetical protein